MVVEDDADLRDALRFSLQTAGYSVRVFAGGEEGETAPDRVPHCLIVDYRLPRRDGLAVVEDWRRRLGPIPAILITSFPGPSLIRRARAADVTLLEKPLIGDRLLELLRELSAPRAPSAATT